MFLRHSYFPLRTRSFTRFHPSLTRQNETLHGVPAQNLEILRSNSSDESAETPRKLRREFTEMFRSMSPYINVHRHTTMVLHLCGEFIDSDLFHSTMHDIALLSTFGIKLVLVAGSRPQINKRIEARGIQHHPESGEPRVTGVEELECAMDAAGSVRVKLESALGRGLVNAPGVDSSVSISSGNFVTAQPLGVRGGKDYKFTGVVRRINASKIRSALDNGDVVVMSNLGYSANGEVFNCMSESVASKTAVALNSSKLIFLHHGEALKDNRNDTVVNSLQLKHATEFVQLGKEKDAEFARSDFCAYLRHGIKACSSGVQRVHLVSRKINGGLLEELFTRDGSGLLLSKDMYEGIRRATAQDTMAIMRLIQPLLDADILVSRNKHQIEASVDNFTVVELDGAIIACAELQQYENGYAEMSCVAVDLKYRSSGKGNALLGYVMRKAQAMGIKKLFVLTTRTMHWFLERGFEPCSLEELPASKACSINMERNSKMYVMDISVHRAVEERELFMNV